MHWYIVVILHPDARKKKSHSLCICVDSICSANYILLILIMHPLHCQKIYSFYQPALAEDILQYQWILVLMVYCDLALRQRWLNKHIQWKHMMQLQLEWYTNSFFYIWKLLPWSRLCTLVFAWLRMELPTQTYSWKLNTLRSKAQQGVK